MPSSHEKKRMTAANRTVMPASSATVTGEESLFCLTDMVLARMMIKMTLQISAGWIMTGRPKSSQLLLPPRSTPKKRSMAMNSTLNSSSSSRRSAMMSTSMSVKSTYSAMPSSSATSWIST